MADKTPPPLPEAQHPRGAQARAGVLAECSESASGDIERLLSEAEQGLATVRVEAAHDPPVAPFHWRDLSGERLAGEPKSLEPIRDVELDLKIELGRTEMTLEDVLELRKGAVVALDRLVGDPVDIIANDRLIARGEVLVLDGNFCVRVTELVGDDAADVRFSQ